MTGKTHKMFAWKKIIAVKDVMYWESSLWKVASAPKDLKITPEMTQ